MSGPARFSSVRSSGVAYASVSLDRPAGSSRPRRLLVLEDFGARVGCAWRETDEQDTDRGTVLRDLLSGQYTYPLRIVAFNAIEGWSRDVTEDIADALADRAVHERLDLSPALEAFVQANSSRPFGLQLALPLRAAA